MELEDLSRYKNLYRYFHTSTSYLLPTTSPFLLPEGCACISVKNDSVIFENKKHPESAVPLRYYDMKYVSACADFPTPARIAAFLVS